MELMQATSTRGAVSTMTSTVTSDDEDEHHRKVGNNRDQASREAHHLSRLRSTKQN